MAPVATAFDLGRIDGSWLWNVDGGRFVPDRRLAGSGGRSRLPRRTLFAKTAGMTGLLGRLVRYFAPPPVADTDALKTLVARESAHISQKVPIDYVEARAHAFAPQLFTEKPFLDALKVCTRESYAAILGDLLILVEGALRPHSAGMALAVGDRIEGLYPEVLATLGPPEHRPDG
jgi:hypothetical protein